jgi:hypothetical protein
VRSTYQCGATDVALRLEPTVAELKAQFPFVIFHFTVVISDSPCAEANEKWKMENGK